MKPVDVLSTSAKNLGGIALIKPVLDSIGLNEIVDRYAPMERKRGISHGDAIEVMVMNRLTSPTPLFRVEDWASEYALEEACGISPGEVNDDRLARALDAVFLKIEEIEADVSIRIMSEYDIKPELVHFDFTSIYFEGAYDESDVLRLGYSRDQKPDKKQVNLGIDVDAGEGMPLFHTSYDGNVPDPRMATENLRKVKERLKPDRLIMVGDRSAVDGEVALMLVDYGLDFIGAVKMTQRMKDLTASIPDEKFTPLNVEGVRERMSGYRAAEMSVEFSHDGRKLETRGIVVLSERKSELDRKRRDEAVAWIESKLREIMSKLNGRKWKEPDFIRKKINSILKKKQSYAHLFRTEVGEDHGRVSFTYGINGELMNRESRLDGKYVLATTVKGWSAEKVVEAYRSRYLAESRIRNLKNDIAVRPIFLHDDRRIRALVFISILALMLYTLIEIIARRRGLRSVWGNKMTPITTNQLLLIFTRINVIEHMLKDRSRVRFLQTLNPIQLEILKRLKFPMPETYVTL
ncbi:MAG: IS1634 family transposase [Thaumarchaeota archaeon]|nr:IS1634 family transposase [Nitrososphaerota archaeon]